MILMQETVLSGRNENSIIAVLSAINMVMGHSIVNGPETTGEEHQGQHLWDLVQSLLTTIFNTIVLKPGTNMKRKKIRTIAKIIKRSGTVK